MSLFLACLNSMEGPWFEATDFSVLGVVFGLVLIHAPGILAKGPLVHSGILVLGGAGSTVAAAFAFGYRLKMANSGLYTIMILAVLCGALFLRTWLRPALVRKERGLPPLLEVAADEAELDGAATPSPDSAVHEAGATLRQRV